MNYFNVHHRSGTVQRLKNRILTILSSLPVKCISLLPVQSLMEVRVSMDFFEHRYYRWNKILLTSIGQWPYNSLRDRFLMFTFFMSFSSTVIVPQIMVIINNLDNPDLIMETAVSLSFSALSLTKFFYFLYNSEKMLQLFNHIRVDWHVLANDRDGYNLHPYAQRGRRATILISVIGCITTSLFVIQPAVPKIIDTLINNGSKPGRFALPVDYCFVDMQKYYFYIILHIFLYVFFACIFFVTYDSTYAVYVLHGCGLFATLGCKLERIVKNEKSPNAKKIMDGLKEPNVDFENLRSCVDMHNDAIEYAELIESTYSWCFFVLMGINMLMISLVGVQIMKETTTYEETIRFTASTPIAVGILLVDNHLGQILMDHSISIRYHILNGNWYELPLRVQKFLLFMLMRCNTACKLTMGKVVILSIESFTVMLKSSMSYLTLLRSL